MLTPVLLCGGVGARLWPMSRKSYPKQFARLVGENTMLQDTALRLSGDGYGRPVIVTNAAFRFIVIEQLQEIGIEPQAILIEPEGRNTAPAVLAATLFLAGQNPDAVMVIAPSDHAVNDRAALHAAIVRGCAQAEAGSIVTFGITPDRPETGFGYLTLAEAGGDGPVPLSGFVEKPNKEAAQDLIDKGNTLWNAGIYLMSVKGARAAFDQYAPEMVQQVDAALQGACDDFGFVRLDPDAWAQTENISIDYAITERAENVFAVRFDGGWSDMGDWNEVWTELGRDENGVSTSGRATVIDCTDTLLRSEDERVEIVGIGLTDIIAIATPDAVLVSQRGRGEDVKKAVEILSAKKIRQAESFPKDYRPWGWFESLAIGDRFQVKRIMVKQGAALSLQSHHHRSEHWIIVQGTACVTLDEEERLLTENQSIYIPLGTVHRITNPGKVDVVMIEVQTGAYLGEDDILRYEDVYARN
ncbi:mannose-1-phosphate guanylyltransferase/mannose-6-phosphate isomerase [Loktanella agnita]|uniref:mannose-1-phosphate guanylyltransferase/mannose-6-phosphate isomerase n=1 Tax=Loktanella agnita TaxID=287097 RepID=UPI0039878581